jgi:hypothetical protein
MLNYDDQLDDIGQSADDPLSESLMLDLSGSGAVKATDLEFDQLIRENQLEESDVAAPGIRTVLITFGEVSGTLHQKPLSVRSQQTLGVTQFAPQEQWHAWAMRS